MSSLVQCSYWSTFSSSRAILSRCRCCCHLLLVLLPPRLSLLDLPKLVIPWERRSGSSLKSRKWHPSHCRCRWCSGSRNPGALGWGLGHFACIDSSTRSDTKKANNKQDQTSMLACWVQYPYEEVKQSQHYGTEELGLQWRRFRHSARRSRGLLWGVGLEEEILHSRPRDPHELASVGFPQL